MRPKVEFQAHTTILPPDLFQKFQGLDFWRDLAATRAHVITTKQTPAADNATNGDHQ